jgi:hypothetical protein
VTYFELSCTFATIFCLTMGPKWCHQATMYWNHKSIRYFLLLSCSHQVLHQSDTKSLTENWYWEVEFCYDFMTVLSRSLCSWLAWGSLKILEKSDNKDLECYKWKVNGQL